MVDLSPVLHKTADDEIVMTSEIFNNVLSTQKDCPQIHFQLPAARSESRVDEWKWTKQTLAGAIQQYPVLSTAFQWKERPLWEDVALGGEDLNITGVAFSS